MNLAAILVLCMVAVLLLSLGGLATWVWLAMATTEEDMRKFADSGLLSLER
jgi:type II secretory pathway component PulJ